MNFALYFFALNFAPLLSENMPMPIHDNWISRQKMMLFFTHWIIDVKLQVLFPPQIPIFPAFSVGFKWIEKEEEKKYWKQRNQA